MHVGGYDFKDAIAWLDGRSRNAIFNQAYSPPAQKQISEREPQKAPACNIRDESKWQDVKRYLVEERGLPAALVECLHQQGLLSADSRRNVMFFRYGLGEDFSRGEAIGANLRGTYGDFKGLTPLTQRDEGYFWFQSGQGEVTRVVITESPIDAMSFAALDEQTNDGATVYLSIDGAGAVPEKHLRQLLEQGGQVILAHDRDRAGEEMAWRIAQSLPSVSRTLPTTGKDWNEQLTNGQQQPFPQISQWKRVAQALGRSNAYFQRITEVVDIYHAGQPLSEQAITAMQQDFQTYRQTQNDFWQWHQAARILEKSDSYLHRIREVALEFNASQPTAVSAQALIAMQQNIEAYKQLQLNSLPPQKLWHKYSEGITTTVDALRVKAIAQRALRDGCCSDVVTKLLLEDPYFKKAQQQLGRAKAQQLVAGAVQVALVREPRQSRQNQSESAPEQEL